MKMVMTCAAALVAAQPVAAHPNSAHAATTKAPVDDVENGTNAAAVKSVLAAYKSAIERLDAKGTQTLFTDDSQVYENGGVEGSYDNYLAKHLGPELGHFKSFKFSDYKVDVRFEGPVALATETYTYRIETEKGEIVDRRGVATSVLKKVGHDWKILFTHGSARKPKGT